MGQLRGFRECNCSRTYSSKLLLFVSFVHCVTHSTNNQDRLFLNHKIERFKGSDVKNFKTNRLSSVQPRFYLF